MYSDRKGMEKTHHRQNLPDKNPPEKIIRTKTSARVIPCQINTVTRHDHHRFELFLVRLLDTMKKKFSQNVRFLGRPRSEIRGTELSPKCVDRYGSIGHISAPMGLRQVILYTKLKVFERAFCANDPESSETIIKCSKITFTPFNLDHSKNEFLIFFNFTEVIIYNKNNSLLKI